MRWIREKKEVRRAQQLSGVKEHKRRGEGKKKSQRCPRDAHDVAKEADKDDDVTTTEDGSEESSFCRKFECLAPNYR